MSEVVEVPVFEIRASSGWRLLDLRELWAYRELIYFLAWRDIKVRYKQTAIGVAWALLQPLAMMVVFTLFFGRMASVSTGGIYYPLFVLTGLVPWQLFSRAITESTNSLVTDQRLITRVYFPRIIVPICSILAGFLDFAVSACLLAVLLIAFGSAPGLEVLLVPVFILLLIVAALGVGFWLSALNVEYRDVMYTVPFLNQFWFFITPVVYPVSQVPDWVRPFYILNPMVGVVEGFRWALLGSPRPAGSLLLTSSVVSVVLLLSGVVWFRSRERTFVDAIGSGGR